MNKKEMLVSRMVKWVNKMGMLDYRVKMENKMVKLSKENILGKEHNREN